VGNSRGARKLARTPHVNQKKKKKKKIDPSHLLKFKTKACPKTDKGGHKIIFVKKNSSGWCF
jgi:hypothetical protein